MEAASHCDKVRRAVASNSGAAASAVVASWCRSALKFGLDPAADPRNELLSGAELTKARELNAPLLRSARPVLDGLFRAIGKAGCCVVLTDADGLILESRTSDGDSQYFEAANLTSGAHWSEALEGTNGIGTCLSEGRALTIHRDQHFRARNIGMSCTDAPIFNATGSIAAALDVSSCRSDYDGAMVAMVTALVIDAAQQIERYHFCQSFSHARIIYIPSGNAAGSALLAIDRDDLILGATRTARDIFCITDAQIDASIPVSTVIDQSSSPADFSDAERKALRQALASTGGNATRAAQHLNISRATLYRKLKKSQLI